MTVAWEYGPKIPLVIGVPIMGDVSLEWAFMLRNLMIPNNTKFISSRGVPVDIARERVVEDFLKTGAEWLFFLDSDVYIESNTIMRMINRKYPILSGLYYTRLPPIVPLCWKLTTEGKKNIPFNNGDIVEADAGGAGCLLINKSVFENKNIDKPYFNWTLGRRPERLESMSEDFYFFRKIRRAGYKFLVDTGIVCKHEASVVIDGKGQTEFLKG